MPILNIIAFLSFSLILVSDKCLIFKLYRKPLNFDKLLQRKIVGVIYFALLVHMVTTPFLISEPNLVVAGSTVSLTFLDVSDSRLNTIITTYYIIPYVVLFVLMTLYIFLRNTVTKCLVYCFEKCSDPEKSRMRSDKLNSNFYEALNEFQIDQLLLANEMHKHQV